MTTTISIAASFQITNGPALTIESLVNVQAYDKVEVELAPGATKEISIQPGAATAIRLLIVKSSLYGSAISYVVSDGATESKVAVTLDGPQLFIGAGVVSLFGVAPKVLKLTSTYTDAAKKARIEVLVGRDAAL